MSKKTILFSVPAKAPRSREPVGDRAGSRPEGAVIDAGSDDWVSDRHARAEDRPAKTAGPSLILDLAAERSLMEVVALSLLAPFALGWFWLVDAMAGRVRF